jgi:hypothetical protein
VEAEVERDDRDGERPCRRDDLKRDQDADEEEGDAPRTFSALLARVVATTNDRQRLVTNPGSRG